MAKTATKTNPKLWEEAKRVAKSRMGGKHSARAMQLATQIYKKRGGGYSGAKGKTSLSMWSKQDWGYAGKKGKSVYLPKEKRERLKSTEKGRRKLARASAIKRAATRAGKQYSRHGLAKGTS